MRVLKSPGERGSVAGGALVAPSRWASPLEWPLPTRPAASRSPGPSRGAPVETSSDVTRNQSSFALTWETRTVQQLCARWRVMTRPKVRAAALRQRCCHDARQSEQARELALHAPLPHLFHRRYPFRHPHPQHRLAALREQSHWTAGQPAAPASASPELCTTPEILKKRGDKARCQHNKTTASHVTRLCNSSARAKYSVNCVHKQSAALNRCDAERSQRMGERARTFCVIAFFAAGFFSYLRCVLKYSSEFMYSLNADS